MKRLISIILVLSALVSNAQKYEYIKNGLKLGNDTVLSLSELSLIPTISGKIDASTLEAATSTFYTKAQVDSINALKSSKTGDTFTGPLYVPTAAAGTNNTQAASTAFVKTATPVTFTIHIDPANAISAPANASNYVWGVGGTISLGTNPRQIVIPINCTLVAWALTNLSTATPSTETSSFYLRVNGNTDNLLSNSIVMKVRNVANSGQDYGSVSIILNAGDRIDLKLTTPTWATPPTSLFLTTTLYFKAR